MPLLSDAGRAVAKSFGTTAPLIGLLRSVFIIDRAGRLCWKHVTAVGATYPPSTTLHAQLADLTGTAPSAPLGLALRRTLPPIRPPGRCEVRVKRSSRAACRVAGVSWRKAAVVGAEVAGLTTAYVLADDRASDVVDWFSGTGVHCPGRRLTERFNRPADGLVALLGRLFRILSVGFRPWGASAWRGPGRGRVRGRFWGQCLALETSVPLGVRKNTTAATASMRAPPMSPALWREWVKASVAWVARSGMCSSPAMVTAAPRDSSACPARSGTVRWRASNCGLSVNCARKMRAEILPRIVTPWVPPNS
ncbi:peroxiredoxin family protein [Streptomyces sp. NPDC127117]|uniref:peroxiredoxin family protein n=1 Tax=Streptomyces sp. NPDC127117 TaxID=3345368 RepID=UPI003644732F